MGESYRVLLPDARAGVVVGKDGARLHRLQAGTGASISVQPQALGCDDRVVHVSSEHAPSPGARTPALVALERLAPLVQLDDSALPSLDGYDDPYLAPEHDRSTEPSSPPKSFTFRMLIPAKQGGPLLGTRGREVAKLREHAHVTVHTSPASDGAVHPSLIRRSDYLVSISAHSLPNLKRALREAVHRLQRRPVGRQIEYRLLVPSSRAGRVIGRKGELLNETRQTTGAQIHFEPPPENDPEGDEERILSISAEEASHPGSLLPAQYALFSLAQRALGTEHPPAERFPVRLLVSDQAARGIIGTGGSMINQLREDHDVKLIVRQHGRHVLPACAEESDAVVEIPPHELTKCMGALRDVSEHLRGKRPDQEAEAAEDEEENVFTRNGEPNEAGSAVVKTAVPSAQAGTVLGKQGRSIAHLRQVSGAKVVLGERRADTRILEISGTLQQVQAAQSLLQALLSSSKPANDEPPSAAVTRPLFPAAPQQASIDVSPTP